MHALKQPVDAPDPQLVARRPVAEIPHEPALRADVPAHVPPPAAAPALKAYRWQMERLRGRALSLVLWMISLSALYAVWYFGTQQRWDFYIRFTNIPTPADVFQKLLEVNRSDKFITNVWISVRRILPVSVLPSCWRCRWDC